MGVDYAIPHTQHHDPSRPKVHIIDTPAMPPRRVWRARGACGGGREGLGGRRTSRKYAAPFKSNLPLAKAGLDLTVNTICGKSACSQETKAIKGRTHTTVLLQPAANPGVRPWKKDISLLHFGTGLPHSLLCEGGKK